MNINNMGTTASARFSDVIIGWAIFKKGKTNEEDEI